MNIPASTWDLAPLILVAAILVFGFLRTLSSPLGKALIERVRGTAPPAAHDADRLSDTRLEVESLSRRVLELEERLDFAERLLSRGQSQLEGAKHPAG